MLLAFISCLNQLFHCPGWNNSPTSNIERFKFAFPALPMDITGCDSQIISEFLHRKIFLFYFWNLCRHKISLSGDGCDTSDTAARFYSCTYPRLFNVGLSVLSWISPERPKHGPAAWCSQLVARLRYNSIKSCCEYYS